ncbi:MAG: VWA domain-containing protein [Promethearchaeota archaeon]
MGVFPENPCEFAVEFIRRMRNHPDIIQIPSSRQVLSIPKLILARYYRKGHTTPNDYIEIASVTSFPDNQKLAKKIAFEILFPNYNKDLISSFFNNDSEIDAFKEEEDFEPELKSELDQLQDLIDEIESSYSVDTDIITKLEQFIEELNQLKDQEPYKSALKFFQDETEIYREEITDLQKLIEEAKKRLEEKINSLDPEDLKAANQLNLNDLIKEKTIRPWELLTSKALNREDITDDLKELMNSNNFDDLIQTLKYLNETEALPEEEFQNFKKQLKEQIKNLDQLFNAAKNLGETPSFDQNSILKNSIQQHSFEHNFNLVNSLDQYYGTNLRGPLLEQYNNLFQKDDSKFNLPLDSLVKNSMANKHWNELFKKALENEIEQAKKSIKPFEAFKSLANQLRQLSNSCSNLHCSQKIAEFLPEIVKKTLEACKEPAELRNSVEFLRNLDLNPEENDIERIGKKLGMKEEEIFELIEPNYQLLKKLIDKNVQDFERISNLLSQIKDQINQERIKELLRSALAHNNREALGALGHFNLAQTLNSAEEIAGEEGQAKVIGSLTAGNGENLLKQWFIHRKNLPPSSKDKVKELAKQVLIELAIYNARARLGSSFSGPIPINLVRPFTIGDDFENVDLEATMMNILEKGKRLEHIDYDDFFVYETAKGQRCACLELDISGSMAGDKLAYMAICVSMLVYAFHKKDEIGICFFESNTHILKNVREEVDLEQLADELLSVTSKGGTRIQAALQWAQKQFKESGSREKLNILFTDAEFFDLKEAINELRIMRSIGIDFILVCPEISYNLEEAEKMVKIAGGQLLTIKDWEEFPKLISEIINSKF